jgi:hypothetical protein
MGRSLIILTAVALAGTPALWVRADRDTAPLESMEVPQIVDSGFVRAPGPGRGVAYQAVVRAPGSPWVRLSFDDVVLGRTPAGGQPTVLRLTGLRDGAVQMMTASAIRQWSQTSAYFNGDAVLVQIIADPAAPASCLRMSRITAGIAPMPAEGGVANLCEGEDTRVPSTDPAIGRLLPNGCTAWIFDDANNCMLSAGHCFPSQATVIQFNVPESLPDGTPVHPSPDFQFAADPTSVQRLAVGEGADWAYFGCFPNSTTGLTAYDTQNAFVPIAPAPLPTEPQQVLTVRGFGTVEPPVAGEWNRIQKDASGPYESRIGFRITYVVDTSAGNSGSPVLDTTTGQAIGIHGQGGCGEGSGANIGTAIQNENLQYALARPLGVCAPIGRLRFEFPDGIPIQLNPAGDSIRVIVRPGLGGDPEPGTGVLFLDSGAGFVPHPMNEIEPNTYDAIFPAHSCGARLSYYFTALAQDGHDARVPMVAPAATYSGAAAGAIMVHFSDDFEQERGWTTSADESVTEGQWERVTPTATGARVPPSDADGSGHCFVTGNEQGHDVDGGSVSLVSPPIEVPGPGAELRYWRWFTTSSIALEDQFVVEVSIDDGATWLPVETYTSNGVGWIHRAFMLDDIPGFEPTPHLRVRFTASDVGYSSAVEAGVDGVEVRTVQCGAPCPADLNGDGAVSGADLGLLLAHWGAKGEDAADINGDGAVDGADLGTVLAAWGLCP